MGIVPGSTTTMIPVTSWCSSSRAVVMTGTMSRASLSSPYISETTTSSLLEVKAALKRERERGGEREEKGRERGGSFTDNSIPSYFCQTSYCFDLFPTCWSFYVPPIHLLHFVHFPFFFRIFMIHSVNLGKVNTILQLLVQGTIWICLAAQNLTSLGRQLAMLTMWRDYVWVTRGYVSWGPHLPMMLLWQRTTVASMSAGW